MKARGRDMTDGRSAVGSFSMKARGRDMTDGRSAVGSFHMASGTQLDAAGPVSKGIVYLIQLDRSGT
jgi:hypothetical protein